MALTPGTRLGVYEVTAQIGEGGMGQVFRATDTTLSRQVAIKILPDAFAADPDRLARFEREAMTLASLNHPHIAAIYAVEKSAGMHALVMELVEGGDLSQRIARGAIPLDEALPIAKQIADALEAAHEQGIIHRDLKPANIKVRSDGTVKVLDFGLAKVLEPTGAMSASNSMSPTITTPAMTQAGMILGTAAYMSPEQAKGKPLDERTDIWAFGCVLYEMLSGKRAFAGEDVSDTLANVLKSEPDWTALPALMPTPIARLLRRSLEKDRKRRLDSAADARLEIDEAMTAPASGEGVPSVVLAPPYWRRALPWAVAVLALIAAVTTLFLWAPWQPLPAAAPLRVSAELGADASLVIAFGATPSGNAAIVSLDGSLLAFVARPHGGGAPRLYVRRLDQLTASPLPGTEGAAGPFFSPDGQWLGFFGGGKLQKIAVTGGASVTLADAPSARGGSWAEDGTIVFTPTIDSGLWRVPAASGTAAEPLTTLATGQETTHRWPQALPGGRAVLYTVSIRGNYANALLAVQPLPAGTPHLVQRGASYGRYLPSGHLTWVHDGTLFAAPFDLATLAVTGLAVPVVPGVMHSTSSGGAQVEVSHTGTLVYIPGGEIALAAPIDWLTRDGKTRPLRATPASWSGVQISPDGGRLAFSLMDRGSQDVWTYDVARDAVTILTSDPGVDRNPVWTPDGRRLVYASSRRGATNLYWQRADGSGDATPLTPSPNQQEPGSWHPSGRFLAFDEIRPQTGADLLILPVEGDEASGWKIGTPRVFLGGSSNEQQPRFSPDGRWLAYESNESGIAEIYVRPFPEKVGKWPISAGGGTNAVWSRAPGRRELLYLASDRRIMVVPYTVAGDAFQVEKPRVWSDMPVLLRPRAGPSFDLHPDGERVAMAPGTAGAAGPTHVTLIFNFFDELRRLAPRGK